MKKNYKNRAIKKIFLIFLIIFSFFIIGDYTLSKVFKPYKVMTTEITIENTVNDFQILDIFTEQEINRSLIFKKLDLIMLRIGPSMHTGTLTSNDAKDNLRKISLIVDEVKRIQLNIDSYVKDFIKQSEDDPLNNSPVLGEENNCRDETRTISSNGQVIETQETKTCEGTNKLGNKNKQQNSNLYYVKYAIDNNFEYILVNFEDTTKDQRKKAIKSYLYIYYLILSLIISMFISYFTTPHWLKEYNNLFKKFI